ncbi:MAG: beta strand repeat-containing protein [Anaerolineae bacterium]
MGPIVAKHRLTILLLVVLLALTPGYNASAAGLTVSASAATVLEDAGVQTITLTISGVHPGGANVAVSAYSTNPAVIPTPAPASCPASDSEITCDVQFTPVADAFGTELYLVFAASQPGTGLSSMPTPVRVDVLPVADTPAASPNPATTTEDVTTATITIGRNAVDGTEVSHFRFEGITAGTLLQADGVTTIANGSTLAIAPEGTMTVYFAPAADQHGAAAAFGFQMRGCTSAAGDGLGAATSVGVSVDSVNDAPAVTVPTTATVAEDTPLVFSAAGGNAITVDDVDAGAATLTLTLDATSGTLTLASLTGLTFSAGDGAADAHIAATGTLSDIAAAVAGLRFDPATDYAGPASVTVMLNDGGSSGGGGEQESQEAVSVTVTAANDAPVLTAPTTQTTDEDTLLIFNTAFGNGITVADVDAGTGSLTLQLDATGGTVTGTGLTGSGTASASITGTLTAVNNALHNLLFTPTANSHGSAELLVTVNDNGNTGGAAQQAQQPITITVLPRADTPTAGAASTAEDTPSAAIELSRATVDGSEVGYLRLSGYSGGTLYAADGVTAIVAGSYVALPSSGPLGVVFSPAPNFTGTASFQMRAALDGSGSGLGLTAIVEVAVSAVNDAPTLTLPAAQSTDEDTTLTFGSATGNLIAVSDLDVGSGSVTITLTAQHGRLTLHGLAGLTFTSGDGSEDTAMSFAGMLCDVNNALNQMHFEPDPAFFGTGALVGISASDQGNTGAGGALEAEGAVAITVAAQPDTPTATAPAPTQEDTQSAAITVHRNAADGPEIPHIRVSGVTNGSVYRDDGTTPVPEGSVLDISEPGGLALRFTPAPNLNDASATFGFDVRACSSASCTVPSPAAHVTLSVTAANDPPTYAKGADRFVNGGAGAQTVPGWATAVSAGPSDEGAQSVAFALTTTSTDLFAVPPALSPTGTLTYTPDAGHRGTATVTIECQDSLGQAGASATFQITVNSMPAVVLPSGTWTYTEGDLATLVDTHATVGDADGPANLSGGQLSVAVASGGEAADIIAVGLAASTGITVSGSDVLYTSTTVDPDTGELVATTVTIGTWSGGSGATPLTVPLNGNATLPAVEALLRAVSYHSSSDSPSAATRTIRLRLTDGFVANDGTTAGLPVDKSVAVVPVNDAPSATVPGAQAVQENTPLPFAAATGNGITVADPDAGTCLMTMTATASHGIFSLADSSQLSAVAGDGTALVSARGTLAALNLALEGARFTPEVGYRGGSAGLSIVVDDEGCTGSGASEPSTGMVTIDVRPTADVPAVSPNPASTREDTPLTGLVIQRNASDGAEVTHFKVTVVTGGLLYLADGVTPVPAGSFVTVTEGAAGLVFRPTSEYSGAAAVHVRASVSALDSGLGPETAVANITVLSVSDQPAFVGGADQVVAEDTESRTIAGWATSISTGAANEASQTLAFATEAATPAFFAIQPTVMVNGTLKYTAAENACGSTQVTVVLRDNGGTANGGIDTSATYTFTITIVPVAEAPGVTGTTTAEDTQTFGGLVVTRSPQDGAEVTHFRVSGIENGSVFLSDGVTPVAEGGFITVLQGGTGLRFTPAANFSGTARFVIRGATAATGDGVGSQSVTAAITVASLNDAPVNGLPASPATSEDVPLVFASARGNPVTITDPDAYPGGLLVTLAANHGTLTLATTAGLTFAPGGGDGSADAFMEFRGEVAAIDAAFDGMAFVPSPDYNGTGASILVSSSDEGRSGAGGVQHDVDLMPITVNPVPDRPRAMRAEALSGASISSQVALSRNAADGPEVSHFRISSIRGGSLQLEDGTAAPEGAYITAAQGSAGLRLVPAAGYSGLATFAVQAATGAGPAAVLSEAVVAAIAVGQEQTAALTPGTDAAITADGQFGQTVITVPAGGVTEAVTLTYVAMTGPNEAVPGGLRFAGRTFALAAIGADGSLLHPFPFQQPITLTIDYTVAATNGLDEASLALYYWDGANWSDAAATCGTPWIDRRPNEDRLSVRICHLTEFALLGQSLTEYRSFTPVTLARYHAFVNGDFGGGLVGWQALRGAYAGHGSGLPTAVATPDGYASALLGPAAAQNGALPVGYGGISQPLPVSGRYLQIRYRVQTYDIVRSSSRYYDTFEVSLNVAPAAITDAQRDARGCGGAALNPDAVIVAAGDGLALCGGFAGTAADVGTMHDSGWKTASIDMAGFSGNVTLYLAVWNREAKAPYYDDRGWYNTIAYVDYVRFSDTP